MLNDWSKKWIEDPDGGGAFSYHRDRILEHDPSCSSLAHVWLPRRRGVSCLSEWMSCDVCKVTFGWEGIISFFDDCPDSSHFFCQCCAKKVTACPCGANCAKAPDGQAT